MARLTDVLSALGATTRVRGGGIDAIEVVDVAYDSRHVRAGSLSCCVPGANVDGHEFAAAAIDAGAVALLVEHELEHVDDEVPQLVVDDARLAMALASVEVFGHPSRHLAVVGVTGTNGKTTTTHLLRDVLEAAGRRTAVLGTLSGPRTTPEAPDLQRWFAEQLADGVECVAMEVSSHALALHRVDGTHFAVAVFTNLSRDHLDFHKTMEAYFADKSRLFTDTFTDVAVVNIDDPYGRLLRDAATVRTVGVSLDDVEDLRVGPASSSFRWRGHDVDLPIGGRFNVNNALAAAEAARELGVDEGTIARGFGHSAAVPGRFEPVDEGQPFSVIVDYAHSPDALERLLLAAREAAGERRVHVLFGCGGDRDATKRPAMGEVAARLADRVILTADNSRSEPTATIIDAVKDGYDHATERRSTELVIEEDRRAAIAAAIDGATVHDIVLLAGKGHETTQTIGDRVTPFDDREVAREVLRDLGYSTGGAGR